MNCVIGLTRKDAAWPSTLADLGYEVQVIEQSMRTSAGAQVKPDIIVTSNRLLHCVAFDCKGGKGIEQSQVKNYQGLTVTDLGRWVTVYDSSKLTHDVCYTTFHSNRDAISAQVGGFPLLAFSQEAITKVGKFSQRPIENEFDAPIALEGLRPPVNYYPFSEIDEDAVIIPRILRMLVQLALQTARGGESALSDATFTSEEIVSCLHPYWKALSLDQRSRLKERVSRIIHDLLKAERGFRESLKELEDRKGVKVLATLQQLQREAERIAKEMEMQERIVSYFGQ